MASQRDREKAIKDVVDAWTVEGPDPAYHVQWQQRLAEPRPNGWPALAKAVQRLVDVEGTKNAKRR